MSKSELRWVGNVPTQAGWYWVQWPDGRKTLWSFDTSDDLDSEYLNKKAVLFYGPLEPPEDNEE